MKKVVVILVIVAAVVLIFNPWGLRDKLTGKSSTPATTTED